MERESTLKILIVPSNSNLPPKKQQDGTGFGYYYIIENYKGTITFETEYGKGLDLQFTS
jgi:hypothetical protein